MNAINEDLIKLVIARISTMPPTMKMSIGSQGTFTKEQLIKHIMNGDEIGKLIIKVHLTYLQAMTNQ